MIVWGQICTAVAFSLDMYGSIFSRCRHLISNRILVWAFHPIDQTHRHIHLRSTPESCWCALVNYGLCSDHDRLSPSSCCGVKNSYLSSYFCTGSETSLFLLCVSVSCCSWNSLNYCASTQTALGSLA